MLILKYQKDPQYKYSVSQGATPWNLLVTILLCATSVVLWYYDNLIFAWGALAVGLLMCVINIINSAGDFLREKSMRQPAKLSRFISSIDWLQQEYQPESLSPISSCSVSDSCLNWSESGTLLDKAGISASCCERINVLPAGGGSEPHNIGILHLSNSRVFNSCDLTEEVVRQPLI